MEYNLQQGIGRLALCTGTQHTETGGGIIITWNGALPIITVTARLSGARRELYAVAMCMHFCFPLFLLGLVLKVGILNICLPEIPRKNCTHVATIQPRVAADARAVTVMRGSAPFDVVISCRSGSALV